MELAIVKMLLSLVAVLGLMAALVVGLRKFTRLGAATRDGLVEIEILSQKMIQPKRMLYVVKVLNKVIVLGSSEQGFQALGEIADESVLGALEARQESFRHPTSESGKGFRDRLRSAESLGDFFHKPFNVILWGKEQSSVAPTIRASESVQP